MTPLPGLVCGTLGFSDVFGLVWTNCFWVGTEIKTKHTQNNNWKKNPNAFIAHKKYDLVCHKIKLKINQLKLLKRKENKVNKDIKRFPQRCTQNFHFAWISKEHGHKEHIGE